MVPLANYNKLDCQAEYTSVWPLQIIRNIFWLVWFKLRQTLYFRSYVTSYFSQKTTIQSIYPNISYSKIIINNFQEHNTIAYAGLMKFCQFADIFLLFSGAWPRTILSIFLVFRLRRSCWFTSRTRGGSRSWTGNSGTGSSHLTSTTSKTSTTKSAQRTYSKTPQTG